MCEAPARQNPILLDVAGFVLEGEVDVESGTKKAMSARIPRLRMRAGEVTAIVGCSGCGKSVILSLLMGYPSFGIGGRLEREAFTLFGKRMPEDAFASVGEAASWRRAISNAGGLFYLPQAFPVVKTQKINVEKAISQIIRAMVAPMSLSDMDARIRIRDAFSSREFASRELEMVLTKNLGDLSGGERRRTELLARLVAMKSSSRPALLILDEPTTGFDPANAQGFIRNVRKVIDELRKGGVEAAALFTTHEMSCLDDIADGRRTVDRVCVVNRDGDGSGKGDCTVVFDGFADSVWHRFFPKSNNVRRFSTDGISLFNVLKTRKSAEWVADWDAERLSSEEKA